MPCDRRIILRLGRVPTSDPGMSGQRDGTHDFEERLILAKRLPHWIDLQENQTRGSFQVVYARPSEAPSSTLVAASSRRTSLQHSKRTFLYGALGSRSPIADNLDR